MSVTGIIRFLKSHEQFMDFVSFLYNISHRNKGYIRCLLKDGVAVRGVFMKKTTLDVSGKNAKLYIGRRTQIQNCKILLTGENSSLHIMGIGTNINNASLVLAECGSSIDIGEKFTMEGGHIRSLEGAPIRVGYDCMFSSDIDMASGDYHTITDTNTKERINHSKGIVVSNHVWLGAHSRILKGSIIPKGCVIGNSALVTGELEQENAIYAGIPAKFIKGNIEWSRARNR